MSDRRRKNAVYLVTVPDSFRPQRPWDLPEAAGPAELFVKNLSIEHAQGFCRTFNKKALATGLPDRKWALSVRHSKTVHDPAARVPADVTTAEPAAGRHAVQAVASPLPAISAETETGNLVDIQDASPLMAIPAESEAGGLIGDQVGTSAESEAIACEWRRLGPLEHLAALYDAADEMTMPIIPGLLPGPWWRALLMLVSETGLGLGVLFSLRPSDVDWGAMELRISPSPSRPDDRPAAQLSPFVGRLLQVTLERRHEADRVLLFPWSCGRETFAREFCHLQRLANLDPWDRFRFSDFRKAAARRRKGGRR